MVEGQCSLFLQRLCVIFIGPSSARVAQEREEELDGLPRKKARRKDPPAPPVDAAPAAVARPSAVAAKPTLSPTSMESAGIYIAPDSNCLFFSPSMPISKIHSLPPRTVFPSQTPQAHLRR